MLERQNIIFGDAHGCIDEFNQLLKKINYDKNKHRLISVGDLTDRGSDPVGLIHQIQDIGIEVCNSNHESKALRWRKHEAIKELTGKPNPMKDPVTSRRKEWLSLTKSDLNWISGLPTKIHIKDNWYAVHAGMEPAFDFDKQNPEHIIRIRYVDKQSLKFAKPKDKNQPKNSIFWAEVWNQPYNIIFGHTRFEEPKIFKNKNNTCIGIDCGAVFGGQLVAYNVDCNEFIKIKSKKYY